MSEAGRLTLGLLLVVLAWDAGGLDLPLARLAGSATGFPGRDHWLLASVLHEGGRWLAWVLVLGLGLSAWRPVGPLAGIVQARRLQLVATALLAALVVSLLKAASATSCPWELAEFGGVVRYVPHWAGPDGGTGGCFPAGHAVSGFAFAGGYFAFRQTDAALARRWLAGAAVAGLVLGLAQQWRGAHLMSHTLWSALVCWLTALAVDAAWQLPAAPQVDPA